MADLPSEVKPRLDRLYAQLDAILEEKPSPQYATTMTALLRLQHLIEKGQELPADTGEPMPDD